jgi:hypothetical protein
MNTDQHGFRIKLSFTALLLLLLACCALAQQPANPPNDQGWRGTWAASAGLRSFHGRWWAQLIANSQNAASGSWTLLSDSNQIVLEGTWSARKTSNGWQGTWTARVNSGTAFSGTWTADNIEGKTFADMLKLTLEKQIAGAWRSRGMQGNWWLMGPG